MLKYYNWDVVMAEVPDEITLAINISNCPHRCKGCHSPELQENLGEELTVKTLMNLIDKNRGVTCISFMGGDSDIESLNKLAFAVKCRSDYPYKVAWYSGNDSLDLFVDLSNFNYIKLGPYNQSRGPLNKPTTNQRFYEVIMSKNTDEGGNSKYKLNDITSKFWNK